MKSLAWILKEILGSIIMPSLYHHAATPKQNLNFSYEYYHIIFPLLQVQHLRITLLLFLDRISMCSLDWPGIH